MARNTVHCNDLDACEICNNCLEKNHPWYFCSCDNDNFGSICYPENCDEFISIEEGEDNEDDDFDLNESIECPRCGNDAI